MKLGALNRILVQGFPIGVNQRYKMRKTKNPNDKLGFGADHGARTRDLNLGKVALYQLS